MTTSTEYTDKICAYVLEQGITIEKRFRNSITNVYTAYYESGDEKEIKKIILPQFTDDSDLIKTYAIAHELGHHMIYLKEFILKKMKQDTIMTSATPSIGLKKKHGKTQR